MSENPAGHRPLIRLAVPATGRRAQVRSTIRLAAQFVAAKEREAKRGNRVQWAPRVRAARLDTQGEPTGEMYSFGPAFIVWGQG